MSALTIREMTDADLDDVIALWTAAGLVRPWNDPAHDIAFAMAQENATVLVGLQDGRIVTSVMTGHDGHRGTVYYVSVDPDCRGTGAGRQIMAAAENWLLAKGVWKVNLMVRATNEPVLGFYDALGYTDSQVVTREKWIDPSKRFAEKP